VNVSGSKAHGILPQLSLGNSTLLDLISIYLTLQQILWAAFTLATSLICSGIVTVKFTFNQMSSRSPASTKAFPFLKLPAELRCRIYFYAFIPASVRLSIRDKNKTISLYSFANSQGNLHSYDEPAATCDGFSTVSVSLARFVINRQLWYEISDLFYTLTLWSFPSVEIARDCLCFMGQESRKKICKVSFTTSQRRRGDMAVHPSKDLQKILYKMPRLRYLIIHLSLTHFHTAKSSWDMAVEQPGESDRVAAKWVHAAFVWQGLETRLPFQERGLSKYFLDELKKLCGEKNLRIEEAGKDRYAGKLINVVIGSSTSRTLRITPARLTSFERVLTEADKPRIRRMWTV
jgi:hypothetical protein